MRCLTAAEVSGTFEAYCTQRWKMTRQYANSLVRASETVAVMETIVSILPTTETQVRPLPPLKDTPALAVAAWEDAQALSITQSVRHSLKTP